jgi:outer membrane protein
VAQAYFDVLAAQDSVQVAQSQKQAISTQLEMAKRNFEVGTATITDSREAQSASIWSRPRKSLRKMTCKSSA